MFSLSLGTVLRRLVLVVKFIVGSVCRLAPREVDIQLPVPCVVNKGWLVNEICYIEAAVSILSMVLRTGVTGTSAAMLVHFLLSIALVLGVRYEAKWSLQSWLLLRGQTGVHPGIPKFLLWIVAILSHPCHCKRPHNVYSFVLSRLNYAALTWIAIQRVLQDL